MTQLFRPGVARLLAQRTNWHSLGDRFSGDHLSLQTEDFVWAGVLVLFFGGLLGALKWLAYWDKMRRERPNPKRLFADLCDAHGLSEEDRDLLRAVAGENELTRPADLFVRPELFAKASGDVTRLYAKLFRAAGG